MWRGWGGLPDKPWPPPRICHHYPTVCTVLSLFLFLQRMLASPDAFRSVEDDFCNLQETKTKLKSPKQEEQFDAVIQQLRSRWEEVKRKIDELHPRVQVMAENFSEYKEKLQSLAHWVQGVEQTCDALERVEDYNEFQPLMQTFQVLWPY